ncbi:hypothetical protein Tco_0876229 [Tanacetum coccineum]|uniref:Uncharacterized protein n=1 Tax=Tanacetum coccineum TaxID=301880 RepID=A0ABQ5BV51_9ASTR
MANLPHELPRPPDIYYSGPGDDFFQKGRDRYYRISVKLDSLTLLLHTSSLLLLCPLTHAIPELLLHCLIMVKISFDLNEPKDSSKTDIAAENGLDYGLHPLNVDADVLEMAKLHDDLEVTAAKVCVTAAKLKLVMFGNLNEKYAK